MSRILVVAQCFGLLPVSGVTSSSSRGLFFRRRSLRTIYATLLSLILMAVAISSVIHMVRSIDSQEFGIKGECDLLSCIIDACERKKSKFTHVMDHVS